MPMKPLIFYELFESNSFLRDIEGSEIQNHEVRIFSEECKFMNRSIAEVLDSLIEMKRCNREKLVEIFLEYHHSKSGIIEDLLLYMTQNYSN